MAQVGPNPSFGTTTTAGLREQRLPEAPAPSHPYRLGPILQDKPTTTVKVNAIPSVQKHGASSSADSMLILLLTMINGRLGKIASTIEGLWINLMKGTIAINYGSLL